MTAENMNRTYSGRFLWRVISTKIRVSVKNSNVLQSHGFPTQEHRDRMNSSTEGYT